MSTPRCLFALAPVFAPLVSSPAAGEDLAAVEALLKKGADEMTAGNYEAACPALAESHRIDPRLGTLFTLAECQAKAGKIATAAALYDDYLRAVAHLSQAMKRRHDEQLKTAEAQKRVLATQIPELTLALPPGASAGIRVERDGIELPAPSLGIALPVDPGDHMIKIHLPGERFVEQRIRIEKGEKKTLELQADEGFAAVSDTKSMGVQAIGFGVALTSFAAGTVLVLTAPSSKKTGSVKRWVSLNIIKVRADGAVMGLKGAF